MSTYILRAVLSELYKLYKFFSSLLIFIGSEIEEDDDCDDTLDMPSTLDSQINGSVSNGTNQTPTPTDNQTMSEIQFTQPEIDSLQSQVPQTECNTGYLTPRLNQAGTHFLGLQNNSRPTSQTSGKTDITPQRPPRGIHVTQRHRPLLPVQNYHATPLQVECDPVR